MTYRSYFFRHLSLLQRSLYTASLHMLSVALKDHSKCDVDYGAAAISVASLLACMASKNLMLSPKV